MVFDFPQLVAVFGFAAAAAGLCALWARRVRVARALSWSADLASRASGTGRWGPAVAAAVVFLAGLGLAGPRWGRSVVTAERRGLDLVIAVDISRSMLAEDVEPSRLGRAREQAMRLVHDLSGDRIGLIAFSGHSFILSPLTTDAAALQLLIGALHPDMASEGGTEMARALRQGVDLLLGGQGIADRVLVIFTDGEAHDSLSDLIEQAERVRRQGVRLILVAEGGDEPVHIPLRGPAGELLGFQEDPEGGLVETRRRDDILRAIADAAHAPIVAAGLPDQARAVRDLVAGYRRAPEAFTSGSERVPRGWIAALVGSSILIVHALSRPTAALWVVLLVLVPPSPSGAQGVRNPADSAWVRGEFRLAAERYLSQVRAGEGGDTAWYNLGTAAMALGDTAAARQALGRVARSVDPEMRRRALYNLGLLALRMSQRDSARREQWLEEAVARYREVLLLSPGDRDAKWNLELALRQRRRGGLAERQLPSGGGGGGAPEGESEGSVSALTLEQALEILEQVSEEERSVRRMLSRAVAARESRRGKNW
jgi:Ca-activated chloride channel family protein